MSLHRGCLPWQKLTQEIVKLTRACRETVAGLLFVFVDHGAGIRSATYLCLDCAKNVDKNWNITASFIIHVNFDHAWAEHYPVTLMFVRQFCHGHYIQLYLVSIHNVITFLFIFIAIMYFLLMSYVSIINILHYIVHLIW